MTQVPRRPAALLAWLRHRREVDGTTGRRRVWIGGAVATALALGWMAAPASVGPTEAGGVTHWGGWPLETAFAGVALAAALVTFRTLEVIYRAADARALLPLPIPGGALAWDRCLVGLRESSLILSLVALFVAPAALRAGGVAPTLGAFALVGVAAFIVPAVAFIVLIGSGLAAAAPASVWGKLAGTSKGGNVQGIYQVAPGAAFGAAAAFLLLAKLGVEEPLRVYAETGVPEWTNAATVAVVAPLAIILVALGVTLRSYAAFHDVLQARFLESESYRADAGRPYFGETPPQPGRWERRLGTRLAALYRKDRLLLARRFPALRAGVGVASIVGVGLAWSAAATPTALALLGGAWLGVVAAPLRRLERADDEIEYGMGAVLAAPDERAAAARFAAARETLVQATILTLPAVGFGLNEDALVFVAVWWSGAAGMIASQARSLRPEALWWAIPAATTGLAATLGGTLPAAVAAVAFVHGAGGLLYSSFPRLASAPATS